MESAALGRGGDDDTAAAAAGPARMGSQALPGLDCSQHGHHPQDQQRPRALSPFAAAAAQSLDDDDKGSVQSSAAGGGFVAQAAIAHTRRDQDGVTMCHCLLRNAVQGEPGSVTGTFLRANLPKGRDAKPPA